MNKNKIGEGSKLPQTQEEISFSNNSPSEPINFSMSCASSHDITVTTIETQFSGFDSSGKVAVYYEVDSGPIEPVLEEYTGFFSDSGEFEPVNSEACNGVYYDWICQNHLIDLNRVTERDFSRVDLQGLRQEKETCIINYRTRK